jgi:hypothetical protein
VSTALRLIRIRAFILIPALAVTIYPVCSISTSLRMHFLAIQKRVRATDHL